MAHELEFIDGKAQMAWVGETPWHGLGTQVSNDLTPEQMMKAAGLDWEVKKYTSYVEVKGKRIHTGMKALVRTSDNKVLTSVGENWNPVQNAEAFEFFHEFVLSGDMEMHTAGSLKGGQMVWALAKIKESFDLFGGDMIDSYLLFSNPHQYGKSIQIKFTPIRVVCNNTLTMSLDANSKYSYKANHSNKFDPEEAKEILGIAHEKFAKYKELVEYLGNKKFSVENLLNYYAEVFPKTSGKKVEPKSVRDLSRNAQISYAALENQPGAKYAEGSWWQAFNSVTYVTDHIQGRSNENRLYSSWFGTNETRKLKALNKAIEYANVS